MTTAARLAGTCLLSLLISGCSLSSDMIFGRDSNPAPDPAQAKTIRDEVLRLTRSMKFTGALEISPIGRNEAQSGPEDWTICIRENTASGGPRYYLFFVRGSKVIDGRTPVINDRCEARDYQALQ